MGKSCVIGRYVTSICFKVGHQEKNSIGGSIERRFKSSNLSTILVLKKFSRLTFVQMTSFEIVVLKHRKTY